MGFRFRKSIGMGKLFRVNFSKSGVGYSWGTKGVRFTKTAKGTQRTTLSVPGTGVSYVSETPGTTPPKKPKGKNVLLWCLAVFLVIGLAALGIFSASGQRPKEQEPEQPTVSTFDRETAATELTTVPTTEPTTEPTTAPTTEPTTAPTTEATEATTEPTEATTEPTEATTEPTEADEADSYDYILNANSHKFHLPGCGSVKTMNEENKVYFSGTREEVLAQGYEPCGKCHP